MKNLKDLTPEQISFIILGVKKLAEIERATYAEDAGKRPYAVWWQAQAKRAERISDFVQELEKMSKQVESISLDEWLLPKWFRDKTYNFPFLSFLFTLGLLFVMYSAYSGISETAYQRGLKDGQKLERPNPK